MKTSYYYLTLIIFLIAITASTFSQTAFQDLPHFKKIVVSPHINLRLIQGEKEKIEIEAANVELEKINAVVDRGILKIYLDDARLWPKNEKTRIEGKKYVKERYKNVSVIATVTYQDLKTLKIIGEGWLECSDNLENEKFKLITIGETEVKLDFIQAEKLKIKSIGENKIKISSGRVENVKTKLIGENTVSMENVFIEFAKCSAIGENELECNSKELFKVLLIGESEITQFGEARIRKIGIGENDCSYAYNQSKMKN